MLNADTYHLCPTHKVQYPHGATCPKCSQGKKMKRDYTNETENTDANFFIGYEVEHTPAHELKTLFVVGVQPLREILTRANTLQCQAIYFGANQSFDLINTPLPSLSDQLREWVEMINGCLMHVDDFWCTLDFDVKYAEDIVETILVEKHNFIPMISCKIPYANQMGYNATVKIDDKDFDASNPGVWCHKLHSLMDPDKYTNWKKYKDDKIV